MQHNGPEGESVVDGRSLPVSIPEDRMEQLLRAVEQSDWQEALCIAFPNVLNWKEIDLEAKILEQIAEANAKAKKWNKAMVVSLLLGFTGLAAGMSAESEALSVGGFAAMFFGGLFAGEKSSSEARKVRSALEEWNEIQTNWWERED
jgi:hypothetical protein